MMTDITLAKETQLFLFSLPLGIFLSAGYDLFCAARLQIRHSDSAVFLEDILYFVLSAFFSFFFLLKYNCGQVRGYVLVGEGLGWLIWHFTCGKICTKVILLVIKIVKHTFHLIFLPFRMIFRFFSRTFAMFFKLIKMFFKKLG